MTDNPAFRPALPEAESRSRPRWPVWILILSVCYYVGTVLLLAGVRRGEVEPLVFARMLATGHMATFQQMTAGRLPPVDRWVQAREWQRFERLEDRGIWRRIAADCGHYEAHPPFFFWAMHAALCLGVPDHWVTTVINLPAAVITGLLIVVMTGRFAGDRVYGVLAGVCWFFSPPVMVIGDAVRSPTLFAGITLLLIWLTIDWGQHPRGRNGWRFVATVALCVLGMLNHFQMAIAIVACGVHLALRLKRDAWVFALAVLVAAGLFLLIDPDAPSSLAFNEIANVTEPVTVHNAAVRVLNIGIGLLHFLAMEPKWTRAVTLIVPITLACGLWQRRREWRDTVRRPSPLHALAGLTLIFLTVDSLFYLSWRLPYHAYGAYYFPGLIVLTPVWLAVGLMRLVRRSGTRAGLVGVLLISSVASACGWYDVYRRAGVATDALSHADLIFSDAANIRGMPRVVDPVDPATWVRTASRAELPLLIDTSIAEGHRIVVAPDASYDPQTRPDALDRYLEQALAKGVLQRQTGLEPLSPNFEVYRMP